MKAINPATGQPIRDYPEHADAETRERLRQAERAFSVWRRSSFDVRGDLMRRAARKLRDGRDGYARLITEEMGKPIAQAEAEIDKCARTCDFYADRAAEFLAEEPVATEAARSLVRFEPLGVVLAVMPWNFPF